MNDIKNQLKQTISTTHIQENVWFSSGRLFINAIKRHRYENCASDQNIFQNGFTQALRRKNKALFGERFQFLIFFDGNKSLIVIWYKNYLCQMWAIFLGCYLMQEFLEKKPFTWRQNLVVSAWWRTEVKTNKNFNNKTTFCIIWGFRAILQKLLLF